MNTFILNDSFSLPKEISSICPHKSYGSLKIKKSNILDMFYEAYEMTSLTYFHHIKDKKSLKNILDENIKKHPNNRVLILNSNLLFSDLNKFILFIKKVSISNFDITIGPELSGFCGTWKNSQDFYNKLYTESNIILNYINIQENYLHLINDYWSFIDFSQNSYETRFFNRMENRKYSLIKRSNNKEKLSNEFNYYKFLPENLKHFFVIPYNFKSNVKESSYEMERLKIIDVSTLWINDYFNYNRFKNLIDILFFFIESRPRQEVHNKQEALRNATNLYKDKVINRVEDLKKSKQFNIIEQFIQNHTIYNSIQQILEHYLEKFDKYLSIYFKSSKSFLCVSHGDLCFSNILYDPTINMLRLIDPKGASHKKDIYQNYLYDIVKLSHSVLGDYDYINNNFYSFDFADDMQVSLKVEKSQIRERNKIFFINILKRKNIDVDLIRILESSLFISMSPLHIENTSKVLAFLLRAIQILNKKKYDF
jgi:hypothetical protein